MRTFHVGGIARGEQLDTSLTTRVRGHVRFINLTTVKNKGGDLVVMNRNGHLVVQDHKGRELERHSPVYGATLKASDGQEISPGTVLVEWDPYTNVILTEKGGTVEFQDIVEGSTMVEEVDDITGFARQIVIEAKDEKLHPQIVIRDGKEALKKYLLPVRAILMVRSGDEIFAGDILAKIPRETTKTKDITGGLPRVVELFEARRPKEPATIAQLDGIVKIGEPEKTKRKVQIESESGELDEHEISRGVHINVQEGEKVRAGEPLVDGPIDPHDILSVLGKEELQRYLLNEIQEVYRLQGVSINDKHIETIIRQMLRWVKIEEVGDTDFIVDQQVDKFRFQEENERVIAASGQPARGRPLLLGITKASLSTESFISAASFQETTRVLTEASIQGQVDHLRGLKENVIMGRLIPAGTGFDFYRRVEISPDQPEIAEESEQALGLETALSEEALGEALSAGGKTK
jgi:DNA-directed RNA polymerase subunit beta'